MENWTSEQLVSAIEQTETHDFLTEEEKYELIGEYRATWLFKKLEESLDLAKRDGIIDV